MNTKYLECACDSAEHTLRFTLDVVDNEFAEIYVEVQLNQYLPWYKRVYRAVQYIFGYECKYGHFDTTILNNKNIPQLKDILEEFEHTRLGLVYNKEHCSCKELGEEHIEDVNIAAYAMSAAANLSILPH